MTPGSKQLDYLDSMKFETNNIAEKRTELSVKDVPSIKTISKFKDTFQDSAHTYMNKNGGAGMRMYPALVWKLNNKIFNEDTIHYKHETNLNESSVMPFHSKRYHSLNMAKMHLFNIKK